MRRMTWFGLISALPFLVAGCTQGAPAINNRSMTTLYAAAQNGSLEEVDIDFPPALSIISVEAATSGSKGEIELRTQGSWTEVDGPIVVEAYFDSKDDETIQGRVLVWTSGGYKFGILAGTGAAAVYQRVVRSSRLVWLLIGRGQAKLDGKQLTLSGDLGVKDAKANYIIIRHAPASFVKSHPEFRFSNDGVATTISLPRDRMRSRPIPFLPKDEDVLR